MPISCILIAITIQKFNKNISLSNNIIHRSLNLNYLKIKKLSKSI